MKLLIKVVIVGIVVIAFILYFGLTIYGKALVTNAASQILHTDVEIAKVKFVPLRLALQLERVNISKWNMRFPEGIVYLVPLRVEFHGLEIKRELEILKNEFSLKVNAKSLLSKPRIWKVDLVFTGVDLADLSSMWPDVWSYGFSNGILDGKIEGTFSDSDGKDCKLYGLLHFYNMVYNESDTTKPDGPLGIPIEEIVEFIQVNDGAIDLDFAYKGPLDELNNPFRYRPGPKIIRALGTHLIRKVSS